VLQPICHLLVRPKCFRLGRASRSGFPPEDSTCLFKAHSTSTIPLNATLSRHVTQSPAGQGFAKLNPTIAVAKVAEFAESLRAEAGADADLRRLIEIWPTLSLQTRVAIVRLGMPE